MSIIEVDARAHPNLSGVERPFFDYWSRNILRPDDPHNQRWIDYEETAVARAEDRNNLIRSVVPIKGARVLDVGCQNGAWLVALGRAGAIPTGMDVDAAGIEAARIRANAYGIDAHRVTGDPVWLTRARSAFAWFLGENVVGVSLFDPVTGGCRDGLHLDRANENQGAESTLSFLLALLELRAVGRADRAPLARGRAGATGAPS